MPRAPIPTWCFALVVVRKGDRFLIVQESKHGQPWYLPAGRVEEGESFADAAVRETREETGLTVEAVKVLGERVHPKTGRAMSYTACTVLDGEAHVADAEELAEIAWITHAQIAEYVPYGLFEPVQAYLDGALGS